MSRYPRESASSQAHYDLTGQSPTRGGRFDMALIHGFDIATTTPPHSGRMVPRHCSYDRFYPDGRRAGLTLSSLTLHRASLSLSVFRLPRFRFKIFSNSLYVQAHFLGIHFKMFNLARIQENRCMYATCCRDEISSSRCKAHGIASECALATLGHACSGA